MGTDYEALNLTIDDGVATVELNRPQKLNAVNNTMTKELVAVVRQVARDKDVRAMVLTGGGRAFCAGQDLTEFGGLPGSGFRVDDHIRSGYNKLVLSMRALEKPIVGAINGVAAGAGANLALATDIRIAADDTKFIQAFIRIGLLPDTGGTWFLPQLVGLPRALELAWTGRDVGAEEALRIGLVNQVVPAAELVATAQEQAKQLAAMPTVAIGMIKRAMYRASSTTLDDALEYEAQLQQSAINTDDHREGVMAFLEKRTPEFVGR